MNKKRMLNMDYYKLDAKFMRKTLPNRNYRQLFRLLKIEEKYESEKHHK